MFAPERGVENPIIRRAIELCDQAAMRVIYHEDAVEVWFAPDRKRVYTTWSQFLADAETVFGARLHDAPETPTPLRGNFGNRGRTPELATAGTSALAGHGGPDQDSHHFNGHLNGHTNGYDMLQSRPQPAPSEYVPPTDLASMRREIKVLERAIRVVGMQSEEWKRECEAARQELAVAKAEMANIVDARLAMAGQGPDRYKQVRQIIVKRLHPDIAGTPDEKTYREKLFKSIWQDIEALDKR